MPKVQPKTVEHQARPYPMRYLPEKMQSGGAERDRTVDPLLAKQVLSQLSYSPTRPSIPEVLEVVGLGRFELPTSPLSGVRSSQLSYRPGQSPSGHAPAGLRARRALPPCWQRGA
jgi:hypothetical protein